MPSFQTKSGLASRTCAAIEPQSETVGGYWMSATTLKPAFFAAATAPPSSEFGGPYETKFVEPAVLVTNAIRFGGLFSLFSMSKIICGTDRFGFGPVDQVGNWQS